MEAHENLDRVPPPQIMAAHEPGFCTPVPQLFVAGGARGDEPGAEDLPIVEISDSVRRRLALGAR